jgi:hypothetical protein
MTAHRAGFTTVHTSTTVREADRIWIASGDIRRYGRHQWGQTGGAARFFWARLFQIMLWVRILTYTNDGDELVLIAEKK